MPRSVKPRSRILNVTHNNGAVINSTRFCSSGSLNRGQQRRLLLCSILLCSQWQKYPIVTTSQWSLFRNSRRTVGGWSHFPVAAATTQFTSFGLSSSTPAVVHRGVSLYYGLSLVVTIESNVLCSISELQQLVFNQPSRVHTPYYAFVHILQIYAQWTDTLLSMALYWSFFCV